MLLSENLINIDHMIDVEKMRTRKGRRSGSSMESPSEFLTRVRPPRFTAAMTSGLPPPSLALREAARHIKRFVLLQNIVGTALQTEALVKPRR
jgi:hypothetical protein